jgi:hypothetical protein
MAQKTSAARKPQHTVRAGSTARAREAVAPAKTTRTSGSETARVRDELLVKGAKKDDTGRTLYWARRPFGYSGQELDRGQVVGLTGALNDEKLVRLGYVLSVLPDDRPHACRFCKAKFIDLETLNAHGAKRHRNLDEDLDLPASRVAMGKDGPVEAGLTIDDNAVRVQELEREEHQMESVAPLHLDRTRATREDRRARA